MGSLTVKIIQMKNLALSQLVLPTSFDVIINDASLMFGDVIMTMIAVMEVMSLPTVKKASVVKVISSVTLREDAYQIPGSVTGTMIVGRMIILMNQIRAVKSNVMTHTLNVTTIDAFREGGGVTMMMIVEMDLMKKIVLPGTARKVNSSATIKDAFQGISSVMDNNSAKMVVMK